MSQKFDREKIEEVRRRFDMSSHGSDDEYYTHLLEQFNQYQDIKRRCYICDSEMEEKIVPTVTGWGEFKTEIDAKVYVCPNCGEKVYNAEETHRLLKLGKLLSNLDKAKSKKDIESLYVYYLNQRRNLSLKKLTIEREIENIDNILQFLKYKKYTMEDEL